MQIMMILESWTVGMSIMLPALKNGWHKRTHAPFARVLPWVLENAVLSRNI